MPREQTRTKVNIDCTTIIEKLVLHKTKFPEKMAYRFIVKNQESEAMTYEELYRRVFSLAAKIKQKAGHQERVILCAEPGLDFVVGFYACLAAGAIAIPVVPPLNKMMANRFLHILNNVQPQLILFDNKISKALNIGQVVNRFVPKVLKSYVGISDTHEQLFKALKNMSLESLVIDASTDLLLDDTSIDAISKDDIAFIQYTSGSTADPKGVLITHGNLVDNSTIIQHSSQSSEQSIGYSWLPPYHDMGLIAGIIQMMFVGGTVILQSTMDFIERPLRWLEMISKYRCNITSGPSFAYELCVAKAKSESISTLDLSCLRVAANGAEPINPKTMESFYKTFEPVGLKRHIFLPCYGLAESTVMSSSKVCLTEDTVLSIDTEQLKRNIVELNDDATRATVLVSSGIPMMPLRIVHPEHFVECQEAEIGEIWLQGQSIAKGYYNNPEETEKTFKAQIKGDEESGYYLRTGDLGFLHEGQLYVCGRIKNMIIIRGQNYYPHDIELAVAQAHPRIRKGCIVAYAKTIDGEESLVIVAELKPKTSKGYYGEIVQSIKEKIGQEIHLIAREIHLVHARSIPKTTSGKLQRIRCKELLETQQLVPLFSDESSEAIVPKHEYTLEVDTTSVSIDATDTVEQEKLRNQVRHWVFTSILEHFPNLPPSHIDINKGFFDLGVDSIKAVEIKNSIQDKLGDSLLLDSSLMFNFPNIQAVIDYIVGALSAEGEENKKIEKTVSADAYEDIAIIGMSCQFPGAEGVDEFWQLLSHGQDAVREISKQRWYSEFESEEIKDQIETLIPLKAGCIDDITDFDAGFFSIAPKEALLLDPQQRLLLTNVWRALENAAINPGVLRGTNTGVFIGISSHDYEHLLFHHHDQIVNPYLATGNAASTAAGRLSYVLGLEGPAMAIDTACSSSLVALHEACTAIHQQECDLAIVGGVNVLLSLDLTLNLAKAGMLSPDGACKTFDKDANGYVRGEGCGMVVLKKLSAAQRDNDRILAVIRGSAVNQDGASSGLTVPNGEAQKRLLTTALNNARLTASEVDFIECHGTGTSLGDPIEVGAIGQIYGTHRSNQSPLYLGAVKTNIGHLEAAAGMAGLIKTILTLQNQLIPPNLHFNVLNPHIRLHFSAEIPTKLTPWKKSTTSLRAGVSSFGFSGTNAHVILEEAPDQVIDEEVALPPSNLFVLSAKTKGSLESLVESYKEYLQNTEDSLSDICYTAAVGRAHFQWRVAIDAESKEALVEALKVVSPVESQMTDERVAEGDLKSAYLEGKRVDWAGYYAPYVRGLKKVSLPTYCFEKTRYWLENTQTKEKNNRLPDDYFYELLWQKESLVNNEEELLGLIWVISDEECPHLDIKSSNTAISIEMQSIETINSIVEWPMNLLGVVYLVPESPVEEVMAHQNKYAVLLLRLAQSLQNKIPQGFRLPLGLVLITQHAQWVLNTDTVKGLENAPMGGIIKALQWEAPQLNPRWFDVDEWALEIIKEGLFAKENPLLASRQNDWYVPTVRQAILGESYDSFNVEGMHWITGGTGGLGLALAEHLVKIGVRELLLTSRRGSKPEIEDTIESFRNQGVEVIVRAVNSGDEQAVRDLINEFSLRIKGIYHLAGIEHSESFEELNSAELINLFQPKVMGAWLLDKLSASLSLNYFVLFSSIASFFGNYHQVAYVAANQYLDALAGNRRARGLPITSINWGPWADVGMAAQGGEQFSYPGMLPLESGMGAFDRLVSSTSTTTSIAVVSPKAILDRLVFMPDPKPKWLTQFLARMNKPRAKMDYTPLALDILGLTPELRYQRLVLLVTNSLQKALKLTITPSPKTGFFDLGADSIMTVEIGRHLQEQLGVELKPTAAFDYPTIEQLAAYLEDRLTESQKSTMYQHQELSQNEPISIIGMACRFPGGANTLDKFWDNLYQGKDGISSVPINRFDIQAYYDSDLSNKKKTHTREFGFIDGLDLFDATFFGISPREALFMDPQQRILLQTTWHALENAGIDPTTLKGKRVGVYVGIQASEYANYILVNAKELPGIYEATGNSLSAAAGRIAFVLGTQGPTMAIDTACSSSLVAMHEAIHALRRGECELAIVGGVNSIINPNILVTLSNAAMLSVDGRCKTFDATANGYGRSEGCGVLILQATQESNKQGMRIWANIRASLVNQDGASSGLTVPNGVAQSTLLQECLLQAGLSPQDIDYIECHGTGTSLGDPIEIGSIAEVYSGRDAHHPLIIGTVKTNIGHLESAAGVAGVIKTVLAMNHRYIPKHLHFHTMNPHIQLETIPALIPTDGMSWVTIDNQPSRAGVSSFGFSGTNAHVILEEAQVSERETSIELGRPYVFVLSAKSKVSLELLITAYKEYLQHTRDALIDICYTAAVGRAHFHWRVAIEAESKEGLIDSLEAVSPVESQMTDERVIEGDLGSAYLEGKNIDWAGYYAPYVRGLKKVSLPTYCFEKTRYWLDVKAKALRPDVFADNRHAFLQSEIPLIPEQENTRYFESVINALYPEFIPDHKIYDYTVIAGAVYLSTALQIAKDYLGWSKCRLMQVEFFEALVLPKDNVFSRMYVYMTPDENETYLIRFYSRIADSKETTLHTQLRLTNTDFIPSSESVLEIKERFPKETSYDAMMHQDMARSLSLSLGEHFLWCEKVYTNTSKKELLVDFRLPQSLEQENYAVYPGLIDSCFQSLIALGSESMKTIAIPFTIESMTWDLSKPLPVAAYGKRIDHQSFSFTLYGIDDEPTATIEGLAIREASLSTVEKMMTRHQKDHIVYQEYWGPLLLDNSASTQQNYHFIGEIPEGLVSNSNEKSNINVYFVPQQDAVLQVMLWVQELIRVKQNKAIFIIRDQAVIPGYEQTLSLAHAGVLGFMKTCLLEMPELNCQLLDVHDDDDVVYGLEAIVQITSNIIAIRKGQAFELLLQHQEDYDAYSARLTLIPGDWEVSLRSRGDFSGLSITANSQAKSLDIHDVEISVHAAGLNFRDILNTLGLYPGDAGMLGGECAGIVTQIGHGVTRFKPGDKVFGFALGSFKSRTVSQELFLVHKPNHLSYEEAAALPVVMVTAYYSLYQMALLKPNERVLIHTAAGGVGLAAIVLAQRLGCTIYATCSETKQSYLRSLGVTHIYNSRNTNFAEEILRDTQGLGVDVVLNTLTGEGFIEASLSCLGKSGHFIEISKRNIHSNEQMAALRPDVVYHIIALDVMLVERQELVANLLESINSLLRSHEIKPLPIHTYPIEDLPKAMRLMQLGTTIGKLVIKIPKPVNQTIRPDASYVITGGLGGLGLLLCEWLSSHGACHIALLARREAAPEVKERLSACEADITYHHVDLMDKVALKQTLTTIQKKYPIRGIFHLAGILEDGIITEQTAQRLKNVWQPKATVAGHLHELTLELKLNEHLDYFVLFSSIASMVGSPSQSNYAAANGFLDVLAYYRKAQKLPALSINWGPWIQAGMAASFAQAHKARGLIPFTPEKGFKWFELALMQSSPVIMLAQVNWNQIQAYVNKASWLSALAQRQHDSYLLDILANTAVEKRHLILENHIVQTLREVLHLPSNFLISPQQDLFTMGMDSLTALEFKNKLQHRLARNAELPTSLFFDTRTVAGILDHIFEQYFKVTSKDELDKGDNTLNMAIIEEKIKKEISKNSIFIYKGNVGVLVIHGVTGTPSEMNFFAEAISKENLTILIPQLAGHCSSIEDLKRSSYQDWLESVDQAFQLIRSCCDIVFIAGLSTGGILGLELAGKYQHEISGLIMLSPTINIDGWRYSVFKRLLLKGLIYSPLRAITYVREKYPYGVKNKAISSAIDIVVKSDDPDIFSKAGHMKIPVSVLFENEKLIKLAKQTMQKVTNPMLIIHSIQDDLVSIKNAEYIRDHIGSKEVELKCLVDSYHLIQIDNEKDLVVEYTLHFINKIIQQGKII